MQSPEATGSYQVFKNMCALSSEKTGEYFSWSKGTVSCSKKKKLKKKFKKKVFQRTHAHTHTPCQSDSNTAR